MAPEAPYLGPIPTTRKRGKVIRATSNAEILDFVADRWEDSEATVAQLSETIILSIQKNLRKLARQKLGRARDAYLSAIGPIELRGDGASASFTFAPDRKKDPDQWLAARTEEGGDRFDMKQYLDSYENVKTNKKGDKYAVIRFLFKESAMSARGGGPGLPIGFLDRKIDGPLAAQRAISEVKAAVKAKGRDAMDLSLPRAARAISPDLAPLRNHHKNSIYANMYRIEQARSKAGKVLRRSAKFETFRVMKKDQEDSWWYPRTPAANLIPEAIEMTRPLITKLMKGLSMGTGKSTPRKSFWGRR